MFRPLINHCCRQLRPKHVLSKQPHRMLFFEPSLKGSIDNEYGRIEWERMTLWNQIRMGFEVFQEEVQLCKEEWRTRIRSDTGLVKDNKMRPLYVFNSEEVIDEWRTACDGDWGEGFSTCSFKLSKDGHGHFSGFLDTERIPKDGTIQRTGWASCFAPEARRSFFRYSRYDWAENTHLILRVRGDGRKYGLVIATKGMFDVTMFDMYNYGLYTHGGPYWQYCKIPLSKFCFTYKGRVQDNQYHMPKAKISSYGITLMDRFSGPFSLEIDYIGLMRDPSHTEEFAYEMYYHKEHTMPELTHTEQRVEFEK